MNVQTKRLKNLSRKTVLFYTVLTLCFLLSMWFVYHNHSLYEKPIAQVIQTEMVESTDLEDLYRNKDQLFTQRLLAEIKNGEYKGQMIHLTNRYSLSGAYDSEYKVGTELFVSVDPSMDEETPLSGAINNVKRDKYVLFVAWVFIFTLLFVGRKQGFYSLISLILNAILLSNALDFYMNHSNISLLWICGISVIIFTILSLLFTNGANEKTFAAIIATLIGTFLSLSITYLVMWITAENGLHYEEMEFITRPYKAVFMAGVFIGSLGAVMDVAITMSTSIFSLYEKDNHISARALKTSGLEIGKDIMGTMTNILFFAYLSGSIPMLILYLKNGIPWAYTISMNLSLELARALAGGIGIVLTIPIGLYLSIFFVNRKRAGLKR